MTTDNIIVAYETHHFLKRKMQGNEDFVALKVDMSKAYDRIEWDFLKAIMLKMGFHVHWVQLIMDCVSSIRFYILDSGKERGQVTPHRGLRQGDPLSPYLFILVTESLTALIRKVEVKGDIHGVSVSRKAPEVSHLLFANENFFFFKANLSEAQNFKNILDKYSVASRQLINLDKSTISFSLNVREEVKNRGERDPWGD